MRVDNESADRQVLQRLLADFANRLNGAIDFWTIVCLGTMPIDRRSFLLDKSQQLCSVCAEIGDVAGASFGKQFIDPSVQRMQADCRRLQNAYLVLEQFRTANLQELRTATDTIRESYHSLRQSVDAVANKLKLDSPEPLVLNAERTLYFAKIVDNLFDVAYQERTAAPVGAGKL